MNQEQEIVDNASGTEVLKRKLESPEDDENPKKPCEKNLKSLQQILQDYKSSISPNPEKFTGIITVRLPVDSVNGTSEWVISKYFLIGGFKWRMYTRFNEGVLCPQLQCNDLNKSKLWVCKANCLVGLVDNDKKIVNHLSEIHNFTWSNRTLYTKINMPSMDSIVTDDHITVQFHIRIITDAGFRATNPNNFFAESALSDVILLVGSQRFYVSKAILAVQSPFFEGLFYSEFAEKDKKEVELTDVDGVQFEEFLNVIYPSNCAITEDNCEFLLKLADMFQVHSVLKACEDFLCQDCRCGTLASLKLADQYKLPRVVTACVATFNSQSAVRAFTLIVGFDDLSATTRIEVLQKFMKIGPDVGGLMTDAGDSDNSYNSDDGE